MPQHHSHLQRLVDDAVAKGAQILAGGKPPASGDALSAGQFYPPTVLADVTEDMVIMQEEIFGPIMCITRLPDGTAGDAEAVRFHTNASANANRKWIALADIQCTRRLMYRYSRIPAANRRS